MGTRVALLSGGVGGAKLALGFHRVMDPAALTVVANSGDDIELFGLRICPDADILTYTLAGQVARRQGWGIAGDSYRTLDRVRELGGTGWFNLGDVDLGLHLFRSELLAQGLGLARVTQRVADALNLGCTVLPMTESYAPTLIHSDQGVMHLQEYLVRHRTEPVVSQVDLSAASRARPAPGVLDALAAADLVVLAPSNPLISIAPILAVATLRRTLAASGALRVAVSPLVAGKSLKGPTDKMLWQLGQEVSPVTVAKMYADVTDVFVLDEADRRYAQDVEALGLRCVCLPTVMRTLRDKQALARGILRLLRKPAKEA